MKTFRRHFLGATIILSLLFGAVVIATQGNNQVIIKTVASTAVPEALGTNGVVFRTIVFIGNKAARTANTGRIWIQATSANDDGGIPITSGGIFSVTAASGNFQDKDFYIDVENNGDGVVAIMMP